ncbi:hypothetical protein [Bradyrhizobium sp.]|uniref:hypothetical protein n=1 Tax=Bradyrhizobium sp. TaxID=376 RepID=UPI00260CFBA9|nr:hypothetical protein [Bradyrhizobium sp.]
MASILSEKARLARAHFALIEPDYRPVIIPADEGEIIAEPKPTPAAKRSTKKADPRSRRYGLIRRVIFDDGLPAMGDGYDGDAVPIDNSDEF